jgi:acyl-coenzyme A synthetase/AMP-(fatty) acid ligase
MARLFRRLGVARGDVVTLLAPNIPDAVVALWAAEAVGIAHPVNTLLRAQDIAAIMRAAGSRVLVTLGGALLPSTLAEAFRSRFGIQVHQAYGMTETACLISVVSVHATRSPVPLVLLLPGSRSRCVAF